MVILQWIFYSVRYFSEGVPALSLPARAVTLTVEHSSRKVLLHNIILFLRNFFIRIDQIYMKKVSFKGPLDYPVRE